MDLGNKIRIFVDIHGDASKEKLTILLDPQELDKIEVGEIKRRIQNETNIPASDMELFLEDILGNTEHPLDDQWVGADLDLEEDSHLILQLKEESASQVVHQFHFDEGPEGEEDDEEDEDEDDLEGLSASFRSGHIGTSNMSHSLAGALGSSSVQPTNTEIADMARSGLFSSDGGSNPLRSTGRGRQSSRAGRGGNGQGSSSSSSRRDVIDMTESQGSVESMSRFSELERRLLWRLVLRDVFSKTEELADELPSSSPSKRRNNNNNNNNVDDGSQATRSTLVMTRKVPITLFAEQLFEDHQVSLLIPEDSRRRSTIDEFIRGLSDRGLKSETSWEELVTYLQSFESSKPLRVDRSFQGQLFPPLVRKDITVKAPSSKKVLIVKLTTGMSAQAVTKRLLATEDLNLHPSDEHEILQQLQEAMVDLYQKELRNQRDSWNLYRRIIVTSEDLLLRYEHVTFIYADQEKESEKSTRKAMASSRTSSDGMSFSVGRGASGTVVSKLGRQILDAKIRVRDIERKMEEIRKAPPQQLRRGGSMSSPRASSSSSKSFSSGLAEEKKETSSGMEDLENQFGLADTDGDGKIDREEWQNWVREKNQMAEEAEQNRKELLAENRRLRNAIQDHPDSSRLERRLRLWEEEKQGLLEQIGLLRGERDEVDEALKVLYDEIESVKLERQARAMNGEYEYLDEQEVTDQEVLSDEENSDDGGGRYLGQSSAHDEVAMENEMMDEFWLSLPRDQLLRRWGQEVAEIGESHTSTMRQLEREKNMLLDKLSAYQRHA